MTPRFRNPFELVTALHERSPLARPALGQLLRESLKRLMAEMAARYQLAHGVDRLTLQALHAAETYLRTRAAVEFADMTWPAFRGTVLFYVAKLASLPFGSHAPGATGPAPLPESDAYRSQALSLPSERVGDFWFGGDWYGGHRDADGSLWILVADVTGHGYFAYLFASSLPAVWNSCWQAAGAEDRPADLLAAMHELLSECLPEGIYAECTLARLRPDGEVTVAPAGGTRLLLRRAGAGAPDLLQLRGAWLGLGRPSPAEQRTWTLAEGDELLLGSDGVFDHLPDRDAAFFALFGRLPRPATLFDNTRAALGDALARAPQRDDITMVQLCRCEHKAKSDSLPQTGVAGGNGAGDVSM